MSTPAITVHGVLAGAYKGRDIGGRTLLTHASRNDGRTALCSNVKEWALADAIDEAEPTCSVCWLRMRKLRGKANAG